MCMFLILDTMCNTSLYFIDLITQHPPPNTTHTYNKLCDVRSVRSEMKRQNNMKTVVYQVRVRTSRDKCEFLIHYILLI